MPMLFQVDRRYRVEWPNCCSHLYVNLLVLFGSLCNIGPPSEFAMVELETKDIIMLIAY